MMRHLFRLLFRPIAVALARRSLPVVLVALLAASLFIGSSESSARQWGRPAGEVMLAERLPEEAARTLSLIKRGGPYPYSKDGVTFSNREKRLPRQPRGYYTEYTVKTPGARDRGARRIIAGGDPQRSGEFYYTDDHYQSFKRIRD